MASAARQRHPRDRGRITRAWGLADDGSDTDRRGLFVLPFSWTTGLVNTPTELVSADGSDTYWEVGKAFRQAIRPADPNTLEMLLLPGATASNPMGEWVLAARDAFVSSQISRHQQLVLLLRSVLRSCCTHRGRRPSRRPGARRRRAAAPTRLVGSRSLLDPAQRVAGVGAAPGVVAAVLDGDGARGSPVRRRWSRRRRRRRRVRARGCGGCRRRRCRTRRPVPARRRRSGRPGCGQPGQRGVVLLGGPVRAAVEFGGAAQAGRAQPVRVEGAATVASVAVVHAGAVEESTARLRARPAWSDSRCQTTWASSRATSGTVAAASQSSLT